MTHKRTVAFVALAAVLGCAVVASAQTQAPPRLNNEQRKRAEALSKLVDDVLMQKYSAPADVALSWQAAYIAAEKGFVYVPYSIGIDGKLTGTPAAMYVRVLTTDALPPSYDGSKTTTMRSYLGQMSMTFDTKDMRNGNIEGTGVVAQDVHFFEPPRDGRLNRGLWLQPGEYNVYIAMQEKPGKDLPKTVVFKQPIRVPNLAGGLAVSSVILASSVEPAPVTSKKQNQLDDPFSLGGTRIVPAPSSRLPRSGEMTAVFFIYNPAAGNAGKPDLLVEYMFYQRVGDGEVPFKSSAPQIFNAETLPPTFDVAAHQQIMGGLAAPLSAFPAGDYRLEVKITDKAAQTTTAGTLDFAVFGQ